MSSPSSAIHLMEEPVLRKKTGRLQMGERRRENKRGMRVTRGRQERE